MVWFGGELPLLCLGAAALELDAVHVGQWMVSRPLVLGPLLGWASGAPGAGVSMGVWMELATLDDLPVGDAVPLNATIAVAAATLLSAGPYAVAPAAAFPAGLALGWLFARGEVRLRARRSRLTRAAEWALDAGRPVPFGRLMALSLGWQLAAAFVFLYGGVAGLGPALWWGWRSGPEFVRQGLELAFMAAPGLGWATLIFALRPK